MRSHGFTKNDSGSGSDEGTDQPPMPTHTPDRTVPDQGRVILFQEQAIRRSWNRNEWWFSVVDVCAVLTGSVDAGAY